MSSEEKYTFSALVSRLLECEEKLRQLYSSAASAASETEAKELFKEFLGRSEARKRLIEEARRLTVTEMALEPITGLQLDGALDEIDAAVASARADPVGKAKSVEGLTSQLYSQASGKIVSISPETSEALLRLAKESAERIKLLSALG